MPDDLSPVVLEAERIQMGVWRARMLATPTPPQDDLFTHELGEAS